MKFIKLFLLVAACYGGYCWYRNGGSIENIDRLVASKNVSSQMVSTFNQNKNKALRMGKNIYEKGVAQINSSATLKSLVWKFKTESSKNFTDSSNIDYSADQFSIEEAATLRKKFINYSMSLRGVPYVLGGTNPKSGLDCSSFIQLSAKNGTGIHLPRTANEQYYAVTPISTGEREPGDLLFFKSNPFGKVTHVGIYLGRYNGDGPLKGRELFINSQSAGDVTGVVISALDSPYWRRTYYSSGRFLPSTVS